MSKRFSSLGYAFCMKSRSAGWKTRGKRGSQRERTNARLPARTSARIPGATSLAKPATPYTTPSTQSTVGLVVFLPSTPRGRGDPAFYVNEPFFPKQSAISPFPQGLAGRV